MNNTVTFDGIGVVFLVDVVGHDYGGEHWEALVRVQWCVVVITVHSCKIEAILIITRLIIILLYDVHFKLCLAVLMRKQKECDSLIIIVVSFWQVKHRHKQEQFSLAQRASAIQNIMS